MTGIKTRGYFAVGLFHPTTDTNVGGAARACACFGASFLAVQGRPYKKYLTDTTKLHRHTPVLQVDNLKDVIPYDCVPVAVEFLTTAKSLIQYHHPLRAFYIFGPESGSLGDDVFSFCRDIVYIPTNYCLNLGCCVNVVLYDRISKTKS